MGENSTKKNIFYNISYQLLLMIIPFITSPYLSRIIGKEGVGIYTYTYSISHYFVLFSVMGLANYGNRAIAQKRCNKEELNITFCGIYIMQIVFTIISCIIYLIGVFVLGAQYKQILLIQTMFVLSAAFDVSWFFYGIEQFKLMVVRNAIVKISTTIFIFLFVKESTDLWKYAFIMAAGTMISQIFLWLKLPKYVQFKKPTWKEIYKHIKPNIILFVPVIAVSLYRIMDKVMLGKISTMEETGLYENADKLVTLPLTIITSIGVVMMPKMANMFIRGENKKTDTYLRDSMQLVLALSIPMAYGMAAIAKEFAPIYYGKEFADCGILIMALSPILIFSSVANVIRTQYLIPKEKDKIYIISVISGAAVNLIINFIFIPKMGAMGAVIGTFFAEFIVMFVQCISIRREINFKQYFKDSVPFFLSGLIMFFILEGLETIMKASLITVFLQIIVGAGIYILVVSLLMGIFQYGRFKYIVSLILSK